MLKDYVENDKLKKLSPTDNLTLISAKVISNFYDKGDMVRVKRHIGLLIKAISSLKA